MLLMKIQSVGYMNMISNDIEMSETIYKNKNDAVAIINREMRNKMRDNFGVHLEDECLFSENYNEKCEIKIKTSKNNSILIIKNNNNIDIYLCQILNGYIYNTEKTIHYYKFFIHNHVYPFQDTSIEQESNSNEYFEDILY